MRAMAARVNKRQYARTRAQNLVAHLRVGDRAIQAPIEDISMGGLLARTTESIAIGTALIFDLARPGMKQPLRLLGVVVDTWIGRGLGIRFDGLDKGTSDRLAELIAELGGMSAPSPLFPEGGLQPEPKPRPSPFAVSAPVPTWLRTATTIGPPVPAPVADLGRAPDMPTDVRRLQELVQQRDKELHAARTEIVRLQTESPPGDAAARIVGRLEIEKSKLEAQLADSRGRSRADVDAAQREAEQARAAIGRLLEALQRLR
jgi:hypothetical protein